MLSKSSTERSRGELHKGLPSGSACGRCRPSVQDTVPPDKATMVVTVYDGTRQPIQEGDFLIRIFDGFQNQLFDKDRPAPTTLFRLPFHNNLQDNCRVLVSGDGFVGAGFFPVKLSLKAVAMVDLMLLPHKAWTSSFRLGQVSRRPTQ